MKISTAPQLGNISVAVPRGTNADAEKTAAVTGQIIGNTLANIGDAEVARRTDLARSKASNALLDYEIGVQGINDDIEHRVSTGQLPYDQARQEYDSRVSKLKAPKIPYIDESTGMVLQRGFKETQFKGGLGIDRLVKSAEVADQQNQFPLALDNLKTIADSPNANVGELLTRAGTAAEAARRAGVQDDEIQKRLQGFRADIAASVARRDPKTALNALSQPESGNQLFDNLTHHDREAVRTLAQATLVKQSAGKILQTFELLGTDAGIKELSAVSQSGMPFDLQDETRTQVNAGITQLRRQRQEERATDIANVEKAIATDNASTTTIGLVHNLYQSGALTPAENAGYTARIESSIMARHKNAAAAQVLAQSLQAGEPLDPQNADHRKALAAAFENETQGMAQGSMDWQATALNLANHARLLPEQASAWVRQSLRSPTPSVAVNAAQFFGALQTTAPDALSSFDTSTKSFATMVSGMIEAGTDAEKAVEIARNNVFEQKAEVTKHRETQYSAGGAQSFAAQSDGALRQMIGRDFGSFWHADPTPTSNLSADFNSQAQRYFVKTGDIGLARKLAWDDLRHVYGVSEVNGAKQVMAFPPERFGVTQDDVRSDIGNFLKGNPQADGSGAADVYLVPDSLTLRAVGDALTGQNVRPSYKLVTKSGDLVVDRNNVPKRYTLPTGEELTARFKAAQDQAAATATAIIEKARQQREMEREFRQLRDAEIP